MKKDRLLFKKGHYFPVLDFAIENNPFGEEATNIDKDYMPRMDRGNCGADDVLLAAVQLRNNVIVEFVHGKAKSAIHP